MMSVGILEEFHTAVFAFLAGALITAVYDIFRIFRRVISHGNFWIGVEDFFFWMFTTIWSFYVLYRENDGSLRLYTIFAMVLGMLVYHGTISEPLVEILGKIFRKLWMILLFPLKKVKSSIIFLEKKLKNRGRRFIMKNKHYLSRDHSLSGGDSDGNKNG